MHLFALRGRTSFFENWKLEIKENYNSYDEIDDRKVVSSEEVLESSGSGRLGFFNSNPHTLKHSNTESFWLSVYGRTTDALASVGYEGRGRLR